MSLISNVLRRSHHDSNQNSAPPPRAVIVKPNDNGFHYSNNPNMTQKPASAVKQLVQQLDLAAFSSDTTIKFGFEGTGFVVVGYNHSALDLIPDQYLPRWSCIVDDKPINNTKPKMKTPKNQTDIPADSKTRICESYTLSSGKHMLEIDLQVPGVPAFFHSVRYTPVNRGESLHNVTLRLDARDSNVTYDGQSWDLDKQGELSPQLPLSKLNIGFRGHTLQWYGSIKKNIEPDLRLDGQPYKPTKGYNYYDGHHPRFVVHADRNDDTYHDLVVSTSHTSLSLNHLLVTTGFPKTAQVLDKTDSLSATAKSSAPSTGVIVGSIVAGVVGLLCLALTIFFGIKLIRKRKARGTWKDSALPPAIGFPASRVSSRSSFSREAVSGDLEYNPEAQKKMEAFNTRITEPLPAIVLHADSGVRIHLPASEIPPHYTSF